MTEYKYKSPVKDGYLKFNLSKKIHNKLLKHRRIRWFDKYEYFYNDKQIILHRFTNILGIILETIAFPLIIFMEGYPDAKHILKRLYKQKKYGAFTSDNIYSRHNLYNEILKHKK